jgi:cAMP phosphodiesterase
VIDCYTNTNYYFPLFIQEGEQTVEVRILGAHSGEAKGSRMTSILIDGVIALDAGSLTASLSLDEQQKIRAILLTHHHFDHSRDLVTLGANGAFFTQPVEIFALKQTFEILNDCLLDGKIYADFSKWPSKDKPFLLQRIVEPLKQQDIQGYDVLPVSVQHEVPSIGFQVTTKDGKSLFYTGDTGIGVTDCWNHISPRLLIIEVSGPNKSEDYFKRIGHLSPVLLKEVLVEFRRIRGYLPRVLIVHIPPSHQREVEREIKMVARQLRARIDIAREGMRITL